MSQVMDPPAPVEVELRPAPPLDMRRAVRLGLAGGAAMVLVAATGIVATFQPRMVIDPIVPLGILFLYLLAFGFGWMAGQPPATLEGYEPATAGSQNVLAGALAGLLAGLCLGLLLDGFHPDHRRPAGGRRDRHQLLGRRGPGIQRHHFGGQGPDLRVQHLAGADFGPGRERGPRVPRRVTSGRRTTTPSREPPPPSSCSRSSG